MKWLTKKRLGKLALVFGILLALLMAFGFAIHLQSKGSVENYKKQLRAAGEKLTFTELTPPGVPPDQNGAEFVTEAAQLLASRPGRLLDDNPPAAMLLVAPGRAAIGWKQADIRYNDKTNSWEDVQAALEQCSDIIALFRQASQRPALDFGMRYDQGLDLRLPHLQYVKQSARILSAAMLDDLRNGELASAVTNLHTMLVLEKHFQNEPLVISQLVRIAMTHITFNATWEFLQAPGLTETQLAELQQDWLNLDFVQATENALQMERAFGEDILQKMRNSKSPYGYLSAFASGSPPSSGGGGSWLEEIAETTKSAWTHTKRKANETLWRISWSYADERRGLQGEQILIDAVRQVRTNGFFAEALNAQGRKLETAGFGTNKENSEAFIDFDLNPRWIFSGSVMHLSRIINKTLAIETARQLAVTAIALKRFQIRHGKYPPDLTALTPEFLPSVPRDPMDGKSLRYRLNPDGTFLLYGIGEDGKDDGGDPNSTKASESFGWQKGRDWVWPQPATVGEIEMYYSERSNGR